jgi:type I thyroxine 5'-deiodinase
LYVVYIQEAHSSDGWQLPVNLRQNVVYADPKSGDERSGVAQACVRNLKIAMPALLDSMDNSTELAYTGWPDRLYVIGRDGRVAFKSAPGPFGFKVAPMRQALEQALNQGKS